MTVTALGQGIAWFHKCRRQGWWVVMVGRGVGTFLMMGGEAKAERFRRAQAKGEWTPAHKRPASVTDFPNPVPCWNHPGFARIERWRRGRRIEAERYFCQCHRCMTGGSP